MSMTGSPARKRPPAPSRLLSVRPCLRMSAQLLRTALRPGQTLGLTEITHPFHPLRGQRFIVLKVRKVSGVEILSLRHTELGSLAIPRDWTDWAPPGTSVEPINGQRSLLVDTLGLLALAELVVSLKRKKMKLDQ